MLEINFQPTKKELRLFSLLLIPFSVLVGYLIDHYSGRSSFAWTLAGVFLLIGVLGSVQPGWIRWFFVGWLVLAFPIGWTISHLVLALVFFGMFLPVGLLLRVFGYDPLQFKAQSSESYWKEMEPVEDQGRYFRQF